MPIAPPSDIVLDVLNAGSPQTQVARMARFSHDQTQPRAQSAPVGLPFDAFSEVVSRRNNVVVRPAAAPPPAALRQFESVVLQNFVENVLPQSDTQAFGHGTSGSVARSWMAEAVASQLSKAGGIGLAETFFQDRTARTTRVPEHPIPAIAATASGSPVDDTPLPVAGFFRVLGNLFNGLFGGDHTSRSSEDIVRISR